jgi:hypothetical protein
VKAIKTEVGSIKKSEGNWRLIKWYESHDDLKSKRQMDQKTRQQNMNSNFEENQNVEQKTIWITKHGYNFETKKFTNRKTTRMTLGCL